jgi:hypothetical protein
MTNHSFPNSNLQHHTIPEIDEIEGLLRTYRPNPDSHLFEKVAEITWMKSTSPLSNQKTKTQMPGINRKMTTRWAFVFLSVLLAVTLVMLTPVGRSLAQSITRFFQIAASDHVTEVVSLTPIPTADPGYPYNLYTLSIAQAEALAGFKVKALADDLLPQNWVFHGANYEPENQKVRLFYSLPSLKSTPEQRMESIYMYIDEQRGEFENQNWSECPNGSITEVKINNWPAELADGAVWSTFTAPTPGVTREWVCEKTEPGSAMTLRWEERDLKYEISVDQFAENTSVWLTRSDLLNLAENMK